jgi:hypothetical protein
LVALAWAAIAEWVAQVAAFQLKDSGFLFAQQLLGAEALGVALGHIISSAGMALLSRYQGCSTAMPLL